MTDYSKMSDFDINKMVAVSLGNILVTRPYDEISGNAVTYQVTKSRGLNKEGLIVYSSEVIRKDFCNNPADAWPIIAESGIGVVPNKKDPYAWDLSSGMLRGIKHSDANPLRAAMIVFLMMKDAEK
ncbi:TPA: phage protein NinX family protein [Serratia marcescens]